jgi:hypothetical protein
MKVEKHIILINNAKTLWDKQHAYECAFNDNDVTAKDLKLLDEAINYENWPKPTIRDLVEKMWD